MKTRTAPGDCRLLTTAISQAEFAPALSLCTESDCKVFTGEPLEFIDAIGEISFKQITSFKFQ